LTEQELDKGGSEGDSEPAIDYPGKQQDKEARQQQAIVIESSPLSSALGSDELEGPEAANLPDK
jgi:hypothetical protein